MDFTERFTKAVLCLTLGSATLVAGCQQEKAVPREVSTRITWREGDLVFRQWTGAAGHAVSLADTGGAYSHVGVVVLRKGEPWVVHAVPGEPDFDGDPDRVKLEPVDAFFSRARAAHGAVMRDADSLLAARVARHALDMYRRDVLFDHAYDDSDTTRVYCTELVCLAYRRAGHPVHPARRCINLPGVKHAVVFPSALPPCLGLTRIHTF